MWNTNKPAIKEKRRKSCY